MRPMPAGLIPFLKHFLDPAELAASNEQDREAQIAAHNRAGIILWAWKMDQIKRGLMHVSPIHPGDPFLLPGYNALHHLRMDVALHFLNVLAAERHAIQRLIDQDILVNLSELFKE